MPGSTRYSHTWHIMFRAVTNWFLTGNQSNLSWIKPGYGSWCKSIASSVTWFPMHDLGKQSREGYLRDFAHRLVPTFNKPGCNLNNPFSIWSFNHLKRLTIHRLTRFKLMEALYEWLGCFTWPWWSNDWHKNTLTAHPMRLRFTPSNTKLITYTCPGFAIDVSYTRASSGFVMRPTLGRSSQAQFVRLSTNIWLA